MRLGTRVPTAYILIICLIISLFILNGCSPAVKVISPETAANTDGIDNTQETPAEKDIENDTEKDIGKNAEPVIIPDPKVITLIAVGDNLIHSSLIKWSKTETGYDFTPLYKNVKSLIASADIAFVNQEAPLGGADIAPSGYPLFNSPQEVGLALAETGFNIVNQANNHGLDQGAKAVVATADFWESVDGVEQIGINRSEEERAEILIQEVQGVKFAWLSYSYGTNGMPMREAYLMNLIDEERMREDIKRAKEISDAVIVSIHWGNEYQLQPSQEQRRLAQFLADQGVLLVIGHHPHVIQTMERLSGAEGNETLIMYSLGNFISAQERRDTMLGGLLAVSFSYDGTEVKIAACGALPLVTHYESGHKNFSIYPLEEYSSELAGKHYVNNFGSPITPEHFESLAAGIWGEYLIPSISDFYKIVPFRIPERAFQTVAAGSAHSAAVDDDGALWLWGSNEYGELGNGTAKASLLPQKIMEDVCEVSLGSRHTLVLKNDGTVWAWGRNKQGQLGDGTNEDRATPVFIMDGAVAVSTSDWHSMAIKADGSLWVWGYNYYGQLGDGGTDNCNQPKKIMDSVIYIDTGSNCSAAIKADGSLWMWGQNLFGQLGNGSTETNKAPLKIMEDVKSVSVRDWHTAALKTDGIVWTWGRNNYGQLGDGTTQNRTTPVQVAEDVALLGTGGTFTLMVKNDSSLWAWGNNQQGQLGTGETDTSFLSSPVKVTDSVTQISAGDTHSTIRTANGEIFCFGGNYHGQLGNGLIENANRPVKVTLNK